jgi:hypothetical protein
MNGATYFARLLEAYDVTHVFFMDAVLRRALAEMEDTKIMRILGHSEKELATWLMVTQGFQGSLVYVCTIGWRRQFSSFTSGPLFGLLTSHRNDG